MGHVMVSSARVLSLLRNRHRSFEHLAANTGAGIDLSELQHRDLLLPLEDVEALARYFKRTWAYMLIDEPEPAPALGRDHRRKRATADGLSEDLLEALAASEEQLQVVADVFPDAVMHVCPYDFRMPDDLLSPSDGVRAQQAGDALRAFLGVEAADQLRPRDEYVALRTWIDALDHRGIYVGQRKINDTSVRAFSLYRDGHALAVVDTGDSGSARVFSLLHEVVHLQMRSAGICDLDERSRIERWCNAIAAATLMPLEVLAHVPVAALRGSPDSADSALRDAAKLVGVSQLALLIRLRDTRLLSPEEFADLERRWSLRRGAERSSQGGDFYLNQVVHVGRRFTRQVLGAYDESVLTAREAGSALEVRQHQLGGLRKWL